MNILLSLPRLGASLLLASSLSCGWSEQAAQAQTAQFVDANRTAISGEISQLSHGLMVQIPRPVVLDIGAAERATLTVPSLSEIIINGQRIAPAQTPVLLAVEPTQGNRAARVVAKGLMLDGKLIAIEAEGDPIPSFVVNQRSFNERVRTSMNLGAAIGNGVAGTMGVNVLGAIGAGLGDRTGTNLANQITSTGGLLGIVGGLLGGSGGKRIIELPAQSTHVLTIRNPAMVVAQLIQLNRETAAGNQRAIATIGGLIRQGETGAAPLGRQNGTADQGGSQTARQY